MRYARRQQGSARRASIDGLTHDGVVTDATRSGRWYEGVASITGNSYYVVSTNGTDGALGNDTGAWVQRFGTTGVLDRRSTTAPGASRSPAASLHAVTTAADGTVLAAGEQGGALLLARIGATGATTGALDRRSSAPAATPARPSRFSPTAGSSSAAARAAARASRWRASPPAERSTPRSANGGQVYTSVGGNAYITAIGAERSDDRHRRPCDDGRRLRLGGGALLRHRRPAARARRRASRHAGHARHPGTTPGTTPVTPTGGTKTATTTPTTPIKKAAKKKLSCIVPKVTGKKLNAARRTVLAKGCKVQLKYVASKKAKNTVLTQSRKAGKKLGYRAVVKLTVADKASRHQEVLNH